MQNSTDGKRVTRFIVGQNSINVSRRSMYKADKLIIVGITAVSLMCILFGCISRDEYKDNDCMDFIPEMNMYIEPDYDTHRVNFFKSPEDKPDFVEFRGYGCPDTKYYPSAQMFYIPPDTILVVPLSDHILKINENNFKILLCEMDTSGYFYNLSYTKHRYPEGIVRPYPGQKAFRININDYFYNIWITDSLGRQIYSKMFKNPDEIHIPR